MEHASKQPSNNEILDLLFCMAPQFANPSAEDLECYNKILDSIRCMVNAGLFSCCSILAYVYLLAHFLTLRKSGDARVVSSMSEGGLSISFAVSQDSDFLDSTMFGKAYNDLIKKTVFAPFVTNTSKRFPFFRGCC